MRFLGFATGLAFGSLLQRGKLARQDVILEQLVLRDGRVIKTMATAVVVGGLAIHALASKGLIKKEIKPMKVGGIVGGAALFGAGLAVLGYCPGTSVTALGAGRKDALAGVLGELVGAGIHVALYSKLAPLMDAGGNFGKATIPGLLKAREKLSPFKQPSLEPVMAY